MDAEMNAPVKLTKMEPIDTETVKDQFVWIYKTNSASTENERFEKWTRYPNEISALLDKAFLNDESEIFIDKQYRIDFIELSEEDLDDPTRRVSIRRQNLASSTENETKIEVTCGQRKRFSFQINRNRSNSTTTDTSYEGSSFVRDWFVAFTNGSLNITFDLIFPALVDGIVLVGRDEPQQVVDDILNELQSIKNETKNKRESKKLKILQDCCAKLYTKQCFLFFYVNTALRDEDRTKLNALGPFCYLVYNYIGENKFGLSVRRFLSKVLHKNNSEILTVYRGDSASRKMLEAYKQAIGKKDKYFKWLPFVSTSLDRKVAEQFGKNILYIIQLEIFSSSDQFVVLDNNTYFIAEKEILLKPGTQFQITKMDIDYTSGRKLVYITIIPSYFSRLM